MAKAYDYLENEALRYGAGVPVGTKFRTLSDEQRQGFDDYMKRKIRNNPSGYADDARAKKYLKDYDQGTFDTMRQQEIRDNVNPGGIWDGFGGGQPTDRWNEAEPEEEKEEKEDRRRRDEEPEEEEPEERQSEETPEENDGESPEEARGQEPSSSENPTENPTETPAEAPAAEGPQPAPGLGESGSAVEGAGAATDAAASGAEALAGAAEGGVAAAEASAAVAAGAETGAAVATGAAATSEIWLPILAIIVGLFLVLSALTALSGAFPDKASAVEAPTNLSNTTMVNGKIPVPYYSQTAPATWHNDPYGDCGTIGTSGCGVTSLAMVISYLTNKTVLPPETAAISVNHGWRVCGSGTAYTALIEIPKLYGLHSVSLGGGAAGWEKDKEYLSKGIPVIQLHHAPSIFTSGGHYIVITGFNGSTVYVNDPVYSHKKFQDGVSENDVTASLDKSWAVYR